MTQSNNIMRTLHNGLKIPAVGTSDFSAQALRLGYRLFDLPSEEQSWKILSDALNSCGIPRYDCTVILHVPSHVHTYDETERFVRQALKKLSASYADIVLLDSSAKGYNTQCWKALEDLYKAGKVHAMGTGQGTSAQLDRLLFESEISPMITEAALYPGCPQKDIVQYARQHSIRLFAVIPEHALSVLASKELNILARKYSISPLELCLRYQADKDSIPIVPQIVRTPEQLAETLSFELTQEDMLYLDNMKDYGNAE